GMADTVAPTPAAAADPETPALEEDGLLEVDLLVQDVSIDGVCGCYLPCSRLREFSTGPGRSPPRCRCGPSGSARCCTTSAPAGCRSSRTLGCSPSSRGCPAAPTAR